MNFLKAVGVFVGGVATAAASVAVAPIAAPIAVVGAVTGTAIAAVGAVVAVAEAGMSLIEQWNLHLQYIQNPQVKRQADERKEERARRDNQVKSNSEKKDQLIDEVKNLENTKTEKQEILNENLKNIEAFDAIITKKNKLIEYDAKLLKAKENEQVRKQKEIQELNQDLDGRFSGDNLIDSSTSSASDQTKHGKFANLQEQRLQRFVEVEQDIEDDEESLQRSRAKKKELERKKDEREQKLGKLRRELQEIENSQRELQASQNRHQQDIEREQKKKRECEEKVKMLNSEIRDLDHKIVLRKREILVQIDVIVTQLQEQRHALDVEVENYPNTHFKIYKYSLRDCEFKYKYTCCVKELKSYEKKRDGCVEQLRKLELERAEYR